MNSRLENSDATSRESLNSSLVGYGSGEEFSSITSEDEEADNDDLAFTNTASSALSKGESMTQSLVPSIFSSETCEETMPQQLEYLHFLATQGLITDDNAGRLSARLYMKCVLDCFTVPMDCLELDRQIFSNAEYQKAFANFMKEQSSRKSAESEGEDGISVSETTSIPAAQAPELTYSPVTLDYYGDDAEFARAQKFIKFLSDRGYISRKQAENLQEPLKGYRYGSTIQTARFEKLEKELNKLVNNKKYQKAFISAERKQNRLKARLGTLKRRFKNPPFEATYRKQADRRKTLRTIQKVQKQLRILKGDK